MQMHEVFVAKKNLVDFSKITVCPHGYNMGRGVGQKRQILEGFG